MTSGAISCPLIMVGWLNPARMVDCPAPGTSSAKVGSARPSTPRPVNCFVGSTSSVQAGVSKIDTEVHTGGAGEIVEAVAVLQMLKLRLEHELERRAQHAAERRDRLGEAADPQVDRAKAGCCDAVEVLGRVNQAVVRPGACAVKEVETIGRRAGAAEHNGRSRRALVRQRDG